MKYRVARIAPLRAAKVAALLWLGFSIILMPLMMVPAFFTPEGTPGPEPMLLLIFPVIYVVMGFVTTLIVTAIYNLVAKRIGGIEVELDQVAAE